MGYPLATKQKAKALKKQGFSYKVISEKLGVATGTLSTWIGRNPHIASDRERQRAHLARIRPIASASKTRIKNEWINAAHQRGALIADNLPKSVAVQKSLLAMLYWAEGSKYGTVHGVRFANTDPELMRYFMTALRQCYAIDESRVRIRMHVHYYHERRALKRFWSKLLTVPESQFGKIYVKKRSKTKRFRKNSKGICYFSYGDSTIREELLGLGRSIAKMY